MDGRGGCCIASYATGAYDMSKVNRIMLRFRPIAPKPVAGGTASDVSSSESGDPFSRGGRQKRKYVKDNNSNKRSDRRVRRRKTTRSPPGPKHPVPAPVVTLPLLPETPDPKDSPASDLTVSAAKEVQNNNNNNNHHSNKNNVNRDVPVWLSFENRSAAAAKVDDPCGYCSVTEHPAARLEGGRYSCVVVECVTETWAEGDGLGSTDEERRLSLSKDTCPGIISDGYGRVAWTNRAYREMVGHEGVESEGAWVALKVKTVVPLSYPSFTCRVRVQYACGKERSSLTVPCDVWRMDTGGFAWRLDVKAALSLSLGS